VSKAAPPARTFGPIELEIETLDPAGDGVAHEGRRAYAIPFTIPGERVRAQPAPRPRPDGVLPARLIEIVRASPHRTAPGCRHFGPGQPSGVEPCGGCAWQHIAYPEQLRLKAALVTRLVRAAVPDAPAARAMVATTPLDSPWGYRHKVHFVFANAHGHAATRRPPGDRAIDRWPSEVEPAVSSRRDAVSLVMGHYARGSRRVVGVRECPVHATDGNARAFALRDACLKAGVLAAEPAGRRRGGVLKSVAVRVARRTKERMMTVVVADDGDRALRGATRRALDAAGDATALHLNLHPRDNAFIFGESTRRIGGPERLRDEVAGVSFLISPTAFFQTNLDAAEVLVELVRRALPQGVPVLDLYAGAGLFALPLARAGHDVVAVEENTAAVADGEASRAVSRIPPAQCHWVAATVEIALGRVGACDTVVLDPPRDGCSAVVSQRLFAERRPSLAVYVSCNPETLARDLAVAARHGYGVESLQPVDMFPHTPHVETVAVLRRRL
jgi:23S rRNA (uracil1939-C5)-methyltransferase